MHKGIIKIGNDFSADYSVHYLRFLSTYVYYIIHDDVHEIYFITSLTHTTLFQTKQNNNNKKNGP